MGLIILFVTLVWMLAWLLPYVAEFIQRIFRELTAKRTANIFEHHYLDSKAYYLYRFRAIPCSTYIDDIDISRAFSFVRDNHGEIIVDIFQACHYNRQAGKQEFNTTIFILKNKVLIELAGQYARVLHPPKRYDFADSLLNALNEYRLPDKKEDFEINIITYSNNCLDLKRLDIKPSALDLGMYYNDDFKEVDGIIRNRLNQQNDKGIVLLHGLPGTGKTTYLRHLIGGLKKKVLFVSPSAAANLVNPDFIDLLIDNQNSILVIEDAENIIMDRKHNADSSVSNLLNLSDGLLSDCLGVQIICTFNSSLNRVDSALMRKGRLIAKYEFGKLDTEKSQALSKHLGFDTVITHPMTIADIANQDEMAYESSKVEVVGFRRQEVAMN
ncbi:MAG TPA: AAA family ATPase [Chitinophagaceae bacterium]|nr:AAA family ATPase [Chitinophagaceae bacterium]